LAGSMPDLEHIGVPILPATADVTPQATEVLDFEPDVIVYSAQGADCWTFVDALGRLGWTPDQIPLVLSGACTDFTAMEAAGDLAVGIYFIGSGGTILQPLDTLEGTQLEDATVYQTKAAEYGLSDDDLFKGFATQGFGLLYTMYQLSTDIVAAGGEVTGQSLADAFAATDGSRETFGGPPLDCAGAPSPYVAVCASVVNVTEWDGEVQVEIIPSLSGLDLVAGTELRPTPA
ncbi:MAG: hypothetical protein AAGA17_08930, partial [Actinomycetota bacterium]